jgi:hypothetical protein
MKNLELSENCEDANGELCPSRKGIVAILSDTESPPKIRLKRLLNKSGKEDEKAKQKLIEQALITSEDCCNYPVLEEVSLGVALFIFEKYASKIIEETLEKEEEIFEDFAAREVFKKSFSRFLMDNFQIQIEETLRSYRDLGEKYGILLDLNNLRASLIFLIEEFIKKNYKTNSLFRI